MIEVGLHIGRPYVESNGIKSKLCANITENGKNKILYYEVDKEYEEYLCTERSDAFLIALVQYAMANGMNISWEVPVTERLAYQLKTIFIPVMSRKFGNVFKNVNLNGEETNEELEKQIWAVGTGVSGGVDSFYSILKNSCNLEKSQNITHLLYASISNHADTESKLRIDFEANLKIMKKISDEINLPIISVFSNESDFFFREIVNWGALRFAGFAYALQKLFSVYYFSSGYQYDEITFGDGSANFDGHHIDLFTLMVASTKSLNFIGAGGELSRIEKVKYIESHQVVKNNLFVCNYENGHNCSECDKCMRTMMELYADGCIEEYKNIFNLNKFNRNRKRYICKMQYRKSTFDKEILSLLKKSHIKISGQFSALCIRPIYLIWQKMKNNKLIMRIFYKLNFDYILYGKDMAESIRYSKGIALK